VSEQDSTLRFANLAICAVTIGGLLKSPVRGATSDTAVESLGSCGFSRLAGMLRKCPPRNTSASNTSAKRIEGEKNPHELRKLAAELNNLVSVRIESLCKRIEGEKNHSRFEELVVELNDLVSPIIKSVQP
jgi:hypothetical protein